MGCNTQFWFGRRKHHCRSCGRLFCCECSEKTAPIPAEQLYHPVRVCDHCYTTLSGQEGQPHVISLTSCDTSEPTNGTEPAPLPGQHQPHQANGLEATLENKLEDKLEDSLVIGETGPGQIEKTDITVE